MRGLHRVSAPTLCLVAALAFSGPLAADDNIARWVDADGVTHFGNLQFAPRDATPVTMAPVNGMDAPERVASSSSAGGPVWTVIDRAPRQNKIGWRGKGARPNYGPITPSQR